MKGISSLRSSILGGVITSFVISFSSPAIAEEVIEFEDVVVTGLREKEAKAEMSATVGSVSGKMVSETKPAHPTEIMDRIPGVHVNVTNGEGHMTAIRQPITTGAVYLYLEDGIPTRSTGFFNHNALYEVNVPQSDGIEVTKGPGTSLYGSDAIGGIINVMTRPAPEKPEAELTLEGGEYGWERALLSGGSNGFRTDINLTHTDGWREATDYDRQSATVRWDSYLDSGATLKTVLAVSDIDQQTAGNSKLSETDYENNPRENYTPISYRKVQATRLSVAYEKELASSLLSITPYYRQNFMELLPNWSLGYDPTVYETFNDSLGLLLKYRTDLKSMRTRIVVGADLDYSPGGREEQIIGRTSITSSTGAKIFTSYSTSSTVYDYDVAFKGASPYIHVETSPTDKLRINAGLRYDSMSYDYENNLSVVTTGKHKRPDDEKVSFSHLSPKLGLTYGFTENINAFASYRHAFRTPSESQLFRQGGSINTVDLDPVKVDSYEVGLRGKTAGKDISYEISAYQMIKKDDILSFDVYSSNGVDTLWRESVNAGETSHEGIEIGLGIKIAEQIDLNAAYSYSEHIYEKWVTASTGTSYSGKAMASAPRETANIRLGYSPSLLNGGKVELEWAHIGDYWMDDANIAKYHGHDLYNLRANMKFGKSWDIFARVFNLNDERYATLASAKTNGTVKEYAPGMPRTAYAGVTYKWSGE
ncbi:MAG: TonB-dependent receptor [bacterium]|nr:TonB-dependent receptor [bacterium]